MLPLRSLARLAGVALVVSAPLSVPLSAQAAPADVGAELMGQFEASARKFVALAEAVPAGDYGWRPMEGTASVVEVYMHVARYNYMYLDENMGVAAPMAYADLEQDVTAKDEAVRILTASMDHVRSAVGEMSGTDLATATRLYGRDVEKWAVLLQLVAHMNEHLGQSIAYARSNGVVPPWSR